MSDAVPPATITPLNRQAAKAVASQRNQARAGGAGGRDAQVSAASNLPVGGASRNYHIVSPIFQ